MLFRGKFGLFCLLNLTEVKLTTALNMFKVSSFNSLTNKLFDLFIFFSFSVGISGEI